jgi:hypothetical protein
MDVLTTASTWECIKEQQKNVGRLKTDQGEHILCTNEHDDQGKDSPMTHAFREETRDVDGHSPRYHGDPEAYEGTDAQASDSTNKHLNGAGEDKAYPIMYWEAFPHRLAERNRERQVGQVDKHGQE